MEFNENYNGLSEELTASQNVEVAKNALKTSEIEQLTVCINSSARVGQRQAIWMRPITDNAKRWLNANGYDYRPLRCSAEPGTIGVIEW